MAYRGLTSDFNLSADLPPDIAIEAQRLNRRQKIADLLMAHSEQPIMPMESKGRFQAPISWAQGLAQLGQAGAGAYISYKNDQGARALGDRYQAGQRSAQQKVTDAMLPTPAVPGTPDTTTTVENRYTPGGVEGLPDDSPEARQALENAVNEPRNAIALQLAQLASREMQGMTMTPKEEEFIATNQGSEAPITPLDNINEDKYKLLGNVGETTARGWVPGGLDAVGGGVEAATQYHIPVTPIQSQVTTPGTPGTPEIPASQQKVVAALMEASQSPYASVRQSADFHLKYMQHQADQAQKAEETAARIENTRLAQQQLYEFQKSTIDERVASRIQHGDEIRARLADARTTAEESLALKKEMAANNESLKRDQLAQQKLLADLKRAEIKAGQTKLVQDEQGNQVIVDMKTGKSKAVTGPEGQPLTGSGKPPTDAQAKANLYATRAREAHNILMEKDKTGASLEDRIDVSGLQIKRGAENVPFVGGVLGAVGNTMLSPDQQRVEQAQRNFVNAILRPESGAVISKEEFTNAIKQYFKQPGDSPEVGKQKAQNRESEIRGLELEAAGKRPARAPMGLTPAPSGGIGPYSDAEKERRYQEWKKSRQ